MPVGRVKLQLVAFLVLSGGVAANILLLQSNGRGSGEARRGTSAGAELRRHRLDRALEQRTLRQVHIRCHRCRAVQIPHDTTDVTRAVQRELQIRGYETGGADGVAGHRDAGRDHGLRVRSWAAADRQAEPAAAEDHSAGRPGNARAGGGGRAQSAEAEAVIKSVQQSLAQARLPAGHVNGRLTADTARAIREFEVDQALPESGRISGPLVARLARVDGEGRIASGR